MFPYHGVLITSGGRIFSAITQAVNLLGGMQTFVKPGERVLIKPNLLKAMPPEAL